MNESLDKLEREVESMLAGLADDLSIEPAEAAVFRVRAAVRHELDEVWLADQDEPVPCELTIERVRSAVREELDRQEAARGVRSGDEKMAASGFPWRRVAAALAAAAVIAIGFGVVYYGQTVEKPAVTMPEPTIEAELDVFLAAAEEVFETDSTTASILGEIDAIEETIEQWETQTAGALDDIMSEIDELLARPDAGEDMSRFGTLPQGAIG